MQSTHVAARPYVAPIPRFGEVETLYHAFKILKSLTVDQGFTHFAVLEVPWEECSIEAASILTNWEPELIQAYDSLGLAKNCPIFRHVRKSTQPLPFRDGYLRIKPCAKSSADGNGGSTQGVVLPVFAPSGMGGAIVFTGSQIDLDDATIETVHPQMLYLFERIILLRETNERFASVLTKREVESLRWTAIGKTSGEIATIFDISENTVNHHIASACRKLDTVNRVHAVATALRLRLID